MYLSEPASAPAQAQSSHRVDAIEGCDAMSTLIRLMASALAIASAIVTVQPVTPVLAQAKSTLADSGLVGKLEGAKVVTDPAAIPKAFQEAPQLAELVKAGKLPPVKDRLPAEPLVIQPVHEIGKYGGTWRRGFTGPGDVENGIG